MIAVHSYRFNRSLLIEHAIFKLEGLQLNVQTNTTIDGNALTYGTANVSFKIFVGMNGSTEYVRLSDANKTTLAANITADSLTITLADASVITPPYTGSAATAVFIGDERITFEGIDGNTLTGVTRNKRTSQNPHYRNKMIQ